MARGRPHGPTFFFLAQAQKVSCRARIICSKSMASVVEFDFLHHQQQQYTTASQDPRQPCQLAGRDYQGLPARALRSTDLTAGSVAAR